MMIRSRGCLRRRAMTLLELLLALGLIVLVSAMMFLFYDICLRSREKGNKLISEGHLARVIANKIADEIRSSNGFLLNAGPGVNGTERMITLTTTVLPDKELFNRRGIKDEPLPGQTDIRQVQYYLAYDQGRAHSYPNDEQGPAPLGLVRREIRTLYQTALQDNRDESIHVDLIAAEIKYLRFRYFDGVEWLDKWTLGRPANDLGATSQASTGGDAGAGALGALGAALGGGATSAPTTSGPSGAASALGAASGGASGGMQVGGGIAGMGNSMPQAVEVTVGYTEIPPPKQEEKDKGFDNDQQAAPPEPYSEKTVTIVVRLQQADVFFGSRLMRAQDQSSKAAAGGGT
jgi:hypothetical protein